MLSIRGHVCSVHSISFIGAYNLATGTVQYNNLEIEYHLKKLYQYECIGGIISAIV